MALSAAELQRLDVEIAPPPPMHVGVHSVSGAAALGCGRLSDNELVGQSVNISLTARHSDSRSVFHALTLASQYVTLS
jgi:hypothetical protein